MSMNNGIYILQTKDQFRVLYTSRIEDLYWSNLPKVSFEPDPARILELFGPCRYTRSRGKALDIAFKMLKENKTEYGIKLIEVNSSWNEIIKEGLRNARKELKYLQKEKPEDLRDISELENLISVYRIVLNRKLRKKHNLDTESGLGEE